MCHLDLISYVAIMLICFHIPTVFYHGGILKLQKYAPHFCPSEVLLYIFSKVHFGQSTVFVFIKYLVIYSCLLQEEKATIKSLAVKLSQHLVDHIKKSLPQLNEQIQKKLWDLRNELKECEAGPPQDPRGAKQFLIQTITGFTKKIQYLSKGELIIK